MPNVIHFEICVDDPASAVEFYTNVFDWNIEKAEDSDYWYISTDHDENVAITGGLTRRFDELNPTVNTIDVPSVDEFAKRVAEAGDGNILVVIGRNVPVIG